MDQSTSSGISMKVPAPREALTEGGGVAALGTSRTDFPPPHRARRLERFERRQRSSEWLIRQARIDAGKTPVAEPGTTSHDEDWIRPPRPARCRWAFAEHVGVHADAHGSHFTGLERCASVWACPVCSAVIRDKRSQDIARGVDSWQAQGGSLVFMTLTVRHKRGDGLKQTLDGVMKAWSQTLTGSPWQRARERYGVSGFVRAVEVTHGGNGWHPHVHVLLFVDREWTAGESAAFEDWFFQRWLAKTEKQDLRQPTREHGIDLRRGDRAVAAYLSKVQEKKLGNEMTRLDMKTGRRGSTMPFEFLERDDAEARHLWLEYVDATKGRRCITWSRGLRDLVLNEESEQSDEEIIEDAVVDRPFVYSIVRSLWNSTYANDPDRMARVLDAAEVAASVQDPEGPVDLRLSPA